MSIDWITRLRRCFEADAVYYTHHAKAEMENEEFGEILDSEVCEAICAGALIEEYADDRPYPSALVFGLTKQGRPLHAVCAFDEQEECAVVITVYQPNPERWIDYKTRRTT